VFVGTLGSGLFAKSEGQAPVGVQVLKVHTMYGDFDVTELVLQELFFSDVLNRIKDVHQYGFVRYLLPEVAEYTRYVHCVNVWAILRLFGASLKEQIAGLLHDVSHTVFSHVGDFVFNHSSALRSYQDDIHKSFLRKMGIERILTRFGYDMSLFDQKYSMLEQKSPDVCADRFEYTIYAGLLNKKPDLQEMLLSYDDVTHIVNALHFDTDIQKWYFNDVALAQKFAMVSLYTTLVAVGSAWNHLVYSWMADALVEAFRIGLISQNEYHFSTDSAVWKKLHKSNNTIIASALDKVHHYKEYFRLCDEKEPCDILIHTKFRGINPLVKTNEGYKPLTHVSQEFCAAYEQTRKQIVAGWRVKFLGKCAQHPQHVRQIIS
jgi:hypothetical protein